MKVAILTIGDEVVIGKIVNTNASYIAKELENQNIVVSGHMAVRDNIELICSGFKHLFYDASIVITTGGLGPTVDDLSKEATAEYFKAEMVLHEEELEKIRGYFSKMSLEMPEINAKQAYFIRNSIIIKNDNGTAPGMIFEEDGQTVVNLPGPPKELEPMLHDTVIPYIMKKKHLEVIKKTYRLMNIGESHAETLIKSLYNKYPNIKIAPYASVGVIDYIITTTNKNEEEVFKLCCKEFEQILANYIIGDITKGINEIIVEMLKNKGKKLSIAESCTGGMVTSMIVDVSGSSQVLLEGLVTYSNMAKINRLGVDENSIIKYGAVSEHVAREMAIGVAKTSGADFGIATTGIAGPLGGSVEKPVGLVYTAIYYNGNTTVFKNNYNGDRFKIRLRTTMGLLYNLFQIVKSL